MDKPATREEKPATEGGADARSRKGGTFKAPFATLDIPSVIFMPRRGTPAPEFSGGGECGAFENKVSQKPGARQYWVQRYAGQVVYSALMRT